MATYRTTIIKRFFAFDGDRKGQVEVGTEVFLGLRDSAVTCVVVDGIYSLMSALAAATYFFAAAISALMSFMMFGTVSITACASAFSIGNISYPEVSALMH